MIAPSELIINPDGSCFHLHLKPEQLADKIIMVGDPDRVNTVASYFDTKECEVSSREFHTITGTYKGKRITTLSHGIGTDNIDIVLNELDALANIDFASRTIKPEFRVSALQEDCNRLFLSGLMSLPENRSGSTESCIFMPAPRKCATRLSNRN